MKLIAAFAWGKKLTNSKFLVFKAALIFNRNIYQLRKRYGIKYIPDTNFSLKKNRNLTLRNITNFRGYRQNEGHTIKSIE